eukprot:4506491-Pleurochrysis_carterae.AAC.7
MNSPHSVSNEQKSSLRCIRLLHLRAAHASASQEGCVARHRTKAMLFNESRLTFSLPLSSVSTLSHKTCREKTAARMRSRKRAPTP